MEFHSQVGQDEFLLENFFSGKRGGVFVDVGAYDGEKFSNTLTFERSMGWSGLCIEPLPSAFSKLAAKRKAICEQVCVSDFEGEADFVECDAGVDEKMLSGLKSNFDPRHTQRLQRVASHSSTRKTPVKKLSSLLEKHSLFDVDLCSIDTEGSELRIVSELDLERFNISVFTIENNYDDDRLPRLMAGKGYDFVARLEQDDVFKRRDVKRLPRTSVFCAVWHGDPERWELLRGHAESLARQSVPVEPIYVFDGGDQPPDWLPGRAVSVREPLTIYQAWNVALSMVSTPFVMNLNLDDRLAPDAVCVLENALSRRGPSINLNTGGNADTGKLLQDALQQAGAFAAAGDWRIRYTRGDTDAVEPCYPAARLPFLRNWPPVAGTETRLGSGTGERGTLGPATMWRMEAHVGAPRYPWRLADGTLLRTAADAAWWAILQNHLRRNVLRLPIVIGNYHSHPADQAEFRPLPHDELSLMNDPGPGISLL